MTSAPDATVVELLRAQQELDLELGPFFTALHTFADRTIEEFFYDTPELRHPVICVEKDRASRLGYYTVRDGYTFVDRINLNVHALRTGADAAETLAHEIVHMWQAFVGKPCKRNYHGKEFHDRMAMYGIKTEGKLGKHTGYTSGQWQAWMEENADLELDKFILPGTERQPTRKMLKQQCPCGYSFRTRVFRDASCNECGQAYGLCS